MSSAWERRQEADAALARVRRFDTWDEVIRGEVVTHFVDTALLRRILALPRVKPGAMYLPTCRCVMPADALEAASRVPSTTLV